MLRTVHVRTIFPTGGHAAHVATYSESGRGDDAHSFFFVLAHPTHAERLARLLSAFFKRPAGWRNAEALLSQIRAAVLEIERASGRGVDLSLALVDAPRLVTLARGEGVVIAETEDGLRASRRVRGGGRALPSVDDVSGSSTWSTEPRPGDRFMLGLARDLDALSGAELAALATIVGRQARSGPATLAAGALAARGGALVVGRFNHVPWSLRAEPPAPEPAAVGAALPSWRRRLGALAVLVLAVSVFVGLTRVDRTIATPRTPARAHAADRPSGPEQGAWTFASPSPIVQRPLAVRGLLFAPRADGALEVLDRATGLPVRTLEGVGEPSCPSVLVEGLIVAGDAEGTLRGLDPDTGTDRWRVALPAPARALVADRERVWAVAGADVVCVDATTGETAWTRAFGSEALEGLDVARGVGAAVGADGTLTAFNPWSGKERWTVDLGAAPLGGPSITKGYVYVALAQGTVASFHVYRGQERWRVALGAPLAAPIVVDAGRVYAATRAGVVAALHVEDGSGWRTPLGNFRVERIVLDGRRVVAISNDGRVAALDGASGEAVEHRFFSQHPRGAPLLAGGRLIALTASGGLEALDWRGPETHAKLR